MINNQDNKIDIRKNEKWEKVRGRKPKKERRNTSTKHKIEQH